MKATLAVLLALPLLGQQLEKERALGAQVAAEIRHRSQPLEIPQIDDYVTRVGAKLLAQLPETNRNYSFEVLNASRADPMPLPGGYVLIPANSLLAAQTEAEFARVLAHAIAHVELRHGMCPAERGQVVNMSGIPLIFIGGLTGFHADPQASLPVPQGLIKMPRASELEADRFGLDLATRAGFSANDEEFQRMQQILRATRKEPQQARTPTLRRR